MLGRIHSFQSLGTLDGPGLRAVVFLQGCPLRCICCHNPDTWEFDGGEVADSGEILQKILRLKNYFGAKGGVTLSGGEPLAQPLFAAAILEGCRAAGIHTALDTSGAILGETQKALLELTDLVLLDYKYTAAQDYIEYTGLAREKVDEFLTYLALIRKPVWLRQVIIPGRNDSEESVRALARLARGYGNIERIELLPFRKLCLEKYHSLGIPFPLEDTPEASPDLMARLNRVLDEAD